MVNTGLFLVSCCIFNVSLIAFLGFLSKIVIDYWKTRQWERKDNYNLIGPILSLMTLGLTFIGLVYTTILAEPKSTQEISQAGESIALTLLPVDTLPPSKPSTINILNPTTMVNTPNSNPVSTTTQTRVQPTTSPLPPAATPLPSVVMPFHDDFDQELRPEWRIIDGQPVITNGSLSAAGFEELKMEIGDSSLSDYIQCVLTIMVAALIMTGLQLS